MNKSNIFIVIFLILVLLQVSAETQKRYAATDVVQKVAPLPESIDEEGQFINRCVQELTKEKQDILKEEANARCKFRQLKTKALTVQANEMREMTENQFIEMQIGKMLLAADMCETEKCKELFRKRIEKLNDLQSKFKEALQSIEEKKLQKIKNFNDLKKSEYFIKYDPSISFKARAIDPIKLDIARKNFLKAEQNFISVKERARITKQQFDKAKIEIINCTINDTEIYTSECNETRKILNIKAKEHLINTAERILEHLKKLKGKIESNDDLTEEEASEMVEKVDEQISIIEEEKIKIENSESKEEIIQSAKRLRLVWAGVKQSTNLQIQRTVNARMGGIVVQLNQLGIKLERVLARITEDNVDVSGIEALVEEFDKKVEEARINYEKAQEKFKEAKSEPTPNTDLIKEAQGYMQKAHGSLQEAQEKLKGIVLEIKGAGGASELEAVSEEKIEEQLEGQA